MKKLFCLLLLVCNISYADDLKIISYGPKSGPTTNLGLLISQQLPGTPSVAAVGECQDSTRQYREAKKAIAIVGHASVVKGQSVGKDCEFPFKDNFVFSSAGYYTVCSAVPGPFGRVTPKEIKMGVPAVFPIRQFAQEFEQLNNIKLRVINVPGGGEALASVLSGDVDYAILPEFSAVEAERQGKLSCQSLDPSDLTYFGREYKIKTTPFYFMVFVIHKGLSPEQAQSLNKALQQQNVQAWLKSMEWKDSTFMPSNKKVEQIKQTIEQHRLLYK